jgi:hypothetical protein
VGVIIRSVQSTENIQIHKRSLARRDSVWFLLPTVCTHELLRSAADCTVTQRPVQETPIITAPCPAALQLNRGSSRMLRQVGHIPNVSDGSSRKHKLMELLAAKCGNHSRLLMGRGGLKF